MKSWRKFDDRWTLKREVDEEVYLRAAGFPRVAEALAEAQGLWAGVDSP